MKKKRRTRGDPGRWKYQTWAIFADSGVGKTTLAATAPRPRFLDSNKGMLSISGRPGFEHVRSFPVSGIKDLDKAYDNFTGTGRRDWTKTGTVVFDHFDDIQALVLDDLTTSAAERDSRRTPDEPTQKDWGVMGNRLRRYIRKFKSLPMHKILIFAVKEDKITGKLVPNLSGQLQGQLPYFCDVIAYMRIAKGGKRMLYLDGTDRYLAKCRAWWLPRRKWVVKMDDTKFMTRLLKLIAAGPGDQNDGEEE